MKNEAIPDDLRASFENARKIELRNIQANDILSFKRVQFLLKAFENDKLLKLPPVSFKVKAPEWASALQSAFKDANYRQLECIWTCLCNKPLYTLVVSGTSDVSSITTVGVKFI